MVFLPYTIKYKMSVLPLGNDNPNLKVAAQAGIRCLGKMVCVGGVRPHAYHFSGIPHPRLSSYI
jgi:hypothetical protein